MSGKKEDILITILKFVHQHDIDGVLEEDLWKHPKIKGKPNSEGYLNRELSKIRSSNAKGPGSPFPKPEEDALFIYGGGPGKIVLNHNGYFKLLQYQELQEARKGAADANKHAKEAMEIAQIAILINIIAIILQFLIK